MTRDDTPRDPAPREFTRSSKLLSLVLRHRPETIGIELDAEGWVDIDHLIAKVVAHGNRLDRATLTAIVATSDKQRFAISADGKRIRANQGHSLAVDLGLEASEPPGRLFHGTARGNLASIAATGLERRRRQHVHLSPDTETAFKVGQRHGVAVVLIVHAGTMHADGHVFHRSQNGVWLTQAVPARYIAFPDESQE